MADPESNRTEVLGDRRRALEEEFFKRENEKRRQQLRAKMESQAHREGLAKASGISHPEVLDHLVKLGLDAETVIALGLVPLIDVAWSDGKMDERERLAVLSAAREKGIDDASPAGLLLASWLSSPPPPKLREVWIDYVRALCRELDPQERSELREDLLGRARAVAESAGGFLGLGSKISSHEQEELARLEAAFEA
jgi:hypothetical protein